LRTRRSAAVRTVFVLFIQKSLPTTMFKIVRIFKFLDSKNPEVRNLRA
jgi:hypothetical protein